MPPTKPIVPSTGLDLSPTQEAELLVAFSVLGLPVTLEPLRIAEAFVRVPEPIPQEKKLAFSRCHEYASLVHGAKDADVSGILERLRQRSSK